MMFLQAFTTIWEVFQFKSPLLMISPWKRTADFCSMECQAESYILFRDGQPRDVNEVNDDMLTYVVAVS